MSQAASKFHYFLNNKKHVLVVSFIGIGSGKDVDTFIKCQRETTQSTAKFVILNLSGLEDLAPEAFVFLVKLQSSIRDKGKHLYVCGLNRDLRINLVNRGVVREIEMTTGLFEALQKIISPNGNGA